jgi:DNA-directed RNA polymerase specialized sigma subunit
VNALQPNVAVLDALLQKRAELYDFAASEAPKPAWAAISSFSFDPNKLGKGAPKALTPDKELKKKQKQEIQLWHAWNDNGRKPEDLQPLYVSFKPLINKAVSSWSGRVEQVPSSAISAEMHKQFLNAVKSYNPVKAQLNTWVTTNLRKGGRYIKNYQNLGHIPEQQIEKIDPYKKAKEELTDRLGHEPDTASIAEFMGEPVRRIQQLEKEMRQDLSASKFEEADPATILAPKELEALTLIQYDLTPEERTVYEYTFGMNGKQMLKPGEIATKANIHASKVSRIRKKLQDKVNEAMEILG